MFLSCRFAVLFTDLMVKVLQSAGHQLFSGTSAQYIHHFRYGMLMGIIHDLIRGEHNIFYLFNHCMHVPIGGDCLIMEG